MSILSSNSKNLISNYMKEKALPIIGFKNNSSMHDIVQSFISASIGFDETSTEALESFEQLPSQMAGQDSVAELDKIAAKMADKLNGALSDIRSITQESEQLLQEADNLFKKMAAGDPVMSKFLNLQNEKIERHDVTWNKLQDYSAESTLLLSMNMLANIQETDSVDMDRIPFFVNQLPYINPEKNPAYKTIPESKDFSAYLGTVKSNKAVEVGELLTNETKAKRFMAGMLMVFRPINGSIYNTGLDQTEKYLEYLQAFGLIRDGVKEDLTGFGSKEYESFEKNMQTMQSYFDVMGYLIIGQRRTVYQDAFVLPNGKFNSDYAEAFKESGLTDVQVNNAIKYYQSVLGHIPSGGISLDRMKSEMETVDKYINDRFTSAQFNSDAKTKEYRSRALNVLLNAKIQEAAPKNIRGFNQTQVNAILKHDLDMFITGNKTDFDLVSDFLMALNHPFTMSEQIYKDFKKAYSQNLPDAGTITNTDLKMIETKVIAKTVTDFCKKVFC